MRWIRFWLPSFAQTPELKSFYVDCFFDHIAREVMGRGLVRVERQPLKKLDAQKRDY